MPYYEQNPARRGYKDNDTASLAVPTVESAETIRGQCLEAFQRFGDLTADEVAASVGRDKLSVRPRITELLIANKICDAGARRRNSSGKMAKVYTLV